MQEGEDPEFMIYLYKICAFILLSLTNLSFRHQCRKHLTEIKLNEMVKALVKGKIEYLNTGRFLSHLHKVVATE